MPEARPTIEREKIRHRRPNDLMFDEGDAPVSRRSHLTDDADQQVEAKDFYVEEPEVDWTEQEEDLGDASEWDYEPEDDWVLDGDDGQDAAPREAIDDEGGVVWDDDVYIDHPADDDPDEMTFEHEEQGSFGFAPEVELAGRRDIRPKPPRPAPPPRPRAQKRPQQRQPRSQPIEHGWDDVDQPDLHAAPPREAELGAPQQRRNARPAGNGRFSKTRATLGTTGNRSAGGGDEHVLHQPRRGPGKRRRQAQPAPAVAMTGRRHQARPSRPRGRGLIIAGVLALLAVGGWFAYQSFGANGLQPMIERLTSLIPLPGSSRTAADTSFGSQEEAGAVSPEQALSDLERQSQQQNGAQAAPSAAPAASRTDGPPIPKFKPLPGATRSLSAGPGSSAATIEEAQLAANDSGDENDAVEPSIFEQLWRYLSPG